MTTWARSLLLAGAAVATPWGTGHAQHWSFGVGVGAALVGPNGGRAVWPGAFPVTGADRAGFNLRGMADYALARLPVSVRGEVSVTRLSSRPRSAALVDGTQAPTALSDRTLAGTANLVLTMNRAGRAAPYLIAGAGLYHTRLGTNADFTSARVAEAREDVGFGLNGGAGARVRTGGPDLLLELRYHQVLSSPRGSPFIPVTVGVLF